MVHPRIPKQSQDKENRVCGNEAECLQVCLLFASVRVGERKTK